MSSGMPAVAALLALLALPALAPASARAEAPSHPPSDTVAPFYRELRRPGHARAQTLKAHGRRQLEQAARSMSPYRRAAHLEGAITRFELARALAPDDAEAHLYLGIALGRWALPSPDGTTARRTAEAIAALERARALDPDFRANEVGFELGVLLTRARRFEEAAVEYRRGIEASLDPVETSTPFSNLAEVTMLTGDLPGAIALYEQAVVLAEAGGPATTTSLFLSLLGLAVARDRSGDTPGAIAAALRAYSVGGGSFVALRSDDIFFEPEYEIHYYEAVAALAVAEQASGAANKRAQWTEARARFLRYLDGGGTTAAFATAARRHVDALEARLGGVRRPSR